MRRRIYLALPNGGVVCLYRIARTSNGLYVVGMAARAGAGQHLAYHESGICFDHSVVERVRARRQPLAGYTGETSILLSRVVAHEVDAREAVGLDQVRPGDVVIDRPGDIGIEMILSDDLETLPQAADRPNAELHLIPTTPRLLVEVFDVIGPMGSERFPASAEWERPSLRENAALGTIERIAIPIYRIEGHDGVEDRRLQE